jgi:hypothetical protein
MDPMRRGPRYALRLFEANFRPGDGVATAIEADDALGAGREAGR